MNQRLYIIMGVAGSGKSSIGQAVAQKINASYIDGDDFHPQSNIDKMASGDALTDEDRWPWLERVAKELANLNGVGLAGCSALKRKYREFLTQFAGESVQFVYLAGSKDLIAARMREREGHFMPTSLLDSQFAALEEPEKGENYISVDISGSMDQVVNSIVGSLQNQDRKIV